jgi:hypothetical protein
LIGQNLSRQRQSRPAACGRLKGAGRDDIREDVCTTRIIAARWLLSSDTTSQDTIASNPKIKARMLGLWDQYVKNNNVIVHSESPLYGKAV